MSNSFSVATYSPDKVIVDIGGYQLIGWSDMTLARNSDVFKPVMGIRNKHTRHNTLDTSALFTISILQTSPSNDVLSAILQQDSQTGTGRLNITIKDKSGSSVFGSANAFIQGYPPITFSGDFTYRTWKIFCQSTTDYTVGGNTTGSSLLSDLANSVSSALGNLF